MAKTYKLEYKKNIFFRNPSLSSMVIVASLALIGGLIIGYLYSSLEPESATNVRDDQVAGKEEPIELYKEQNLILREIIELQDGYNKMALSGEPPKQPEINDLKASLDLLKDEYESSERGIASHENREAKKINSDIVPSLELHFKEGASAIRNCVVKGKITDVSGMPVEGVKVKILDTHSSITSDLGEYTLEDVPQGRHLVQVFSANEASVPKLVILDDSLESIEDIIFPNPVKEMFFCKRIQKVRSIMGESVVTITDINDEFKRDVGEVICHTRIIGARKPVTIEHRWFWENELVADIPLEVRSNDWRTHSSKQIPIEKTGSWRVEVVKADDDTLLTARRFTVR